MSTNSLEITQLANILHQNGDKVLNALSKLSLNAVLLQKLNKEFESLLDGVGDNRQNFQVLTLPHGNSQLLKDLHFLHDFVQKTVGLKLTNSPNFNLLKNKIDISKFKNIKYLEIKKVPIKEIVGLKTVQSQIESIVCIKCLSVIEELLAQCGGDNSSGFVWSELREAVFSFNNVKVVDTSIAFAPWLQVLDLSHNQITDVKAIECLPNLKYVNLSFNCLDVIPTFNKSARKKIELLVMKNNYIEGLSGLNGLSHLIELDLSNNWIATWDSLDPLLTISTLQWLSLGGNPISCHSYYRQSVAGYLHISASFSDFFLDKVKLSKKEKSIVGIKLCDGNALLTKSHIEGLSKESFKKEYSSSETISEEPTCVTKKTGKARLVVIPNLDDGTYEETPSYVNNLDFISTSNEYLITKKRIENTRSTYGIDNWLVQGSSVVQDILGLPPVQISTSTPCDDLCLKAALDSIKNVVTTVAVIETQPELQNEEGEKNNVDSFVTCNDGDSTSNYFSAETSAEKEENSNKEHIETIEKEPVKQESPDIEEIDETEEVEIDENEKLYVVSKESKTFSDEVKMEEMFLTITETELQEREASRGKIGTKWSLSSLESCVKLKSNKLQLVFDTVRRDRRERIYTLEEKEVNALYKQLVEILESRTLSDMNQIVYKCENCSSQFSAEIKFGKSDNTTYCPFCHSKFILQLDEVPLPSSEPEKKAGEMKNFKNMNVKGSHNRSSSASGFFQNLFNQNEDKIPKCSSQSSIGSALSLEQPNELPTIQNNNVKRSDSDIEILSNPSQSSIEVIDGPGRNVCGNTPRRKRSSEERQETSATTVITAAAANLTQTNQAAALTESSSSGSVTDSICTAYESSNAGMGNKSDRQKFVSEEFEDKDKNKLESKKNDHEFILQDVLSTTRKILNESKEGIAVKYSFTDFTKMDHRIKLFLYTHVFNDSSEEFSFGLRAFVLPLNSDSVFPSCVIVSNKKLYFLKVIDCEQGDDARNFLQKVDSLCFNLNTIQCVFTLTWHQGLGIKIQAENTKKLKQYLILLLDSDKTRNFLNFISTDASGLSNVKIIKDTLERPYLSVQHLLLSSASLDDTNIHYFCLFNSCSISTRVETKNVTFGGILTNSTELLLFTGNLNWLFEETDNTPTLEYFQKFENLVQVYASQTRLILQFFDGVEETEVWSLFMESEKSIEELVKSMRTSWEKLFDVSLQVSSL